MFPLAAAAAPPACLWAVSRTIYSRCLICVCRLPTGIVVCENLTYFFFVLALYFYFFSPLCKCIISVEVNECVHSA